MITSYFKGLKEDAQRWKRVGMVHDIKRKKAIEDNLIRIQTDAKNIAPVFGGELREGIVVEMVDNSVGYVVSNAPYGMEQETGEGMPYYEPIKGKVLEWSKSGDHKGTMQVPSQIEKLNGFIRVSHYTPHIYPALERNLPLIQNDLGKVTINSIKDVGLGRG
jgi:hypothetical protein